MSHIPLDTQQKLLELRLDNDESIIDAWERHLEQKFAMLSELRSALEQISKPIRFLQKDAESKGESLNALEAQRMANSATWLQEIAYNSLRAHPNTGQPVNRYLTVIQAIQQHLKSLKNPKPYPVKAGFKLFFSYKMSSNNEVELDGTWYFDENIDNAYEDLIVACNTSVKCSWVEDCMTPEEKEMDNALVRLGIMTVPEFNRHKEQNDERNVAENPK